MTKKKPTHRMSGLEAEPHGNQGEMPSGGMEGENAAGRMPSFGMGSSPRDDEMSEQGKSQRRSPTEGQSSDMGFGPGGRGMPEGMTPATELEGDTERVLVEMRLPRNLNSAAALQWASKLDVGGFQLDPNYPPV